MRVYKGHLLFSFLGFVVDVLVLFILWIYNCNLALYVTMNNDALDLEANYVTFVQQNNIMDESNEHFGESVAMGNLVIDC